MPVGGNWWEPHRRDAENAEARQENGWIEAAVYNNLIAAGEPRNRHEYAEADMIEGCG
jgi:hypothetical protein